MANEEKHLIKPDTLDGGDPTDPKGDGGGAKSGLGLNRPRKKIEEDEVPYLRLTLEMPYTGRAVNIAINER